MFLTCAYHGKYSRLLKKKKKKLNQHISINEAAANEMLMTVASVAAFVRRIPECVSESQS